MSDDRNFDDSWVKEYSADLQSSTDMVWVVDRFSDRIRNLPRAKADKAKVQRSYIFNTEVEAYRFMDARATKLLYDAIDEATRTRARQKKCAAWLENVLRNFARSKQEISG